MNVAGTRIKVVLTESWRVSFGQTGLLNYEGIYNNQYLRFKRHLILSTFVTLTSHSSQWLLQGFGSLGVIQSAMFYFFGSHKKMCNIFLTAPLDSSCSYQAVKNYLCFGRHYILVLHRYHLSSYCLTNVQIIIVKIQ
jgi:hypothetical protein